MIRLALILLSASALLVGAASAAPTDDPHPGECVPSQYHPCHEEHPPPPPCVDNEFHHCPTAVTDVTGFRVRNNVAVWHTSTEIGVLGFWLYRLGCKPSIRVDAFGDALPHTYRENVAGKVRCPADGRAHRWHLAVVRDS